MLCTVVWESYAKNEMREMRETLERFLRPDSPDWSRSGVYAYWDTVTNDLLYVGLASDLPHRFAEHNGLVSHSGGNKRDKIDAYFEGRERLGFTVVVQAAAAAIPDEIADVSLTLGAKKSDVIAVGEGQLIELHRLNYGRWPLWNGTGGSKLGQKWAKQTSSSLLDTLSARRESLFVARQALRDLEANPRALEYEAALHTARMRTVMEAHGVDRPPEEVFRGLDQTEAAHRIEQFLMLKMGHLIDSLDESNDRIRGWLQVVSQPAFWEGEAEAVRQGMLGLLARGDPAPGDREAAQIVVAAIARGAPEGLAELTEELVSSGYLGSVPAFGAADDLR